MEESSKSERDAADEQRSAEWRCQLNIKSFRGQLARETIESRRATLVRLLAQEEEALRRLIPGEG